MMYGFTIIGIFCAMIYLRPLLTGIALRAVLLIYLLTRAVTKRTMFTAE